MTPYERHEMTKNRKALEIKNSKAKKSPDPVFTEKYQGEKNLHRPVGIHKMYPHDRSYKDKRFDRILDTYQKDKMMKDMHV